MTRLTSGWPIPRHPTPLNSSTATTACSIPKNATATAAFASSAIAAASSSVMCWFVPLCRPIPTCTPLTGDSNEISLVARNLSSAACGRFASISPARMAWFACVITRNADAGIDVEDTARIDDPMTLARHAFAAEEVADLEALTGNAQRLRFFELWTMKEACLKAMGVGLSAGLDQVPDHRQWQFQISRPGVAIRHILTVAIRRGPGPEFQIVERWGVPLASSA